MLAVALGLLSILIGTTTLWHSITKSSNPDDPDASFWYAFTGACIYLPLLLITATISPWLGAATLLTTIAMCLLTFKHAAQALGHRRAEQHSQAQALNRLGLTTRHDSVLIRWSRYELDPASSIDYPAMHDIHVPEVSDLAQALARAEQLRNSPTTADPKNPRGSYKQAIAALEAAFVKAERKITGK